MKALSGISDNLKLLNSEMKTVTSQYDKNDKSAENLSAQSEVLNKKIDEQEKKVKVLSDALAKAKEETGDNSDTTKKWQTELNNAKADLNKLNRELDTNVKTMEEALQGTKEETEAVEDFGEEAEKSGKSALSMGDIIKANLISDAIKGGLQALANGIKAVGGAMADSLTAGAEYADNILTLSAQTGLSTDTLEKYNAVAELTDVSMDTLTKSMAKNIKSMSDARDGSKAYAEAYEKLGVQITDANGNLRDSETVYWETVDALKGVENETERDALAMELFGKKAQELNTVIEMGSEGIKEYTDKAVSMGAVLGGEGLQALGNLDDQMQIFKSSMGSTKNIIASAFAPAMASAIEGVNGLVGSLNGLISAVISGDEGGIENAMNLVSEQVTAMIENVTSMLPSLIEVAKNLLSTLVTVISNNLPYILEQGCELLMSLVRGIASAIPQIIPTVLSALLTFARTIFDYLPQVLQMGINIILELAHGINLVLPELIPLAINAILNLVETLLDNADQLVDTGIELTMCLTDGILTALPQLIDRLPVIIDKLVVAICDNLPKLIEAGIQLTIALTVGILKATPQLLSKLPQIIVSIVSGLLGGLGEMGKVGLNLVQGLWSGIQNATSWIMDKIKGFGKSILDGIKGFFGIHSPSTLFEDEIGTNLALGVGEGFANTMGDVSRDMQNAIPTEFDADIGTNINVATGQTQMSTFDMMVSAFKQALTEVKVVMDDREMGSFVTNTVERVVFA